MLNETVTTIVGQAFMPFEYELLFIAIAFGTLLAMKFFQDIEVLLGLMSTMAFGIAAWFAAYLSFQETFLYVNNTGTASVVSTVTTQTVTPQPILQIFLAVCFLFALITTIYVTFLRNADSTLDKANLMKEEY